MNNQPQTGIIICNISGELNTSPQKPLHKPKLLAVWGNKDPFFLPAGAEAYNRDNPNATVKFYNTGHFALETHAKEIGQDVLSFLDGLPK
jgi:pimeloyl-ACP methyl ester carboxylesterase